jgi:RNA-directed DNA polymerase
VRASGTKSHHVNGRGGDAVVLRALSALYALARAMRSRRVRDAGPLLDEAFYELKENAAAGVDGLTWRDYEQNLERNLENLHARVDRGAYRALPSRRVYILKPDGRQRPLAVAALEDKIVQRATVAVLNAIYEEDFLGFSYGFRPGRGAHDALDALVVALKSER